MEITMDIVRRNAPKGILPVCVSHKYVILARAIEEALGVTDILEAIPVMEEPQSVRLFLTHYPAGVARTFPRIDNCQAAQELARFAVDARYPEKPSQHAERAWKICSLSYQNYPAALATATWLEP